ncbi:MAG: hypothetical protein ACN6N0_11855, partial [Microvirgula sp.]
LMLSACAASSPPSTMPMRPSLPANLAAPAPQIERPTSDSPDDLVERYLALVRQYAVCAAERAGLQQAHAQK